MRQTRRVAFYCILFWAIYPATPSKSAPPSEDVPEIDRPKVGDLIQERWMSSTNWTGDEKLKPKEFTSEPPPVVEKKTFRIFIDPGHGGKDQGAHGVSEHSEAALCVRIAKKVQMNLLRAGSLRKVEFETMMSREGDEFLSLRDRYLAANTWDADLFVSIHANSSPVTKVKGFEVYFLSSEATDEAARNLAMKENAAEVRKESTMVNSILADASTQVHVRDSSQFAETIFNAMSRSVRPNARGVRQGPFTVLAGTDMPAVLIEVGYLTNSVEARILGKETYLNRLANAISSGIVEYYIDRKHRNDLVKGWDRKKEEKTSNVSFFGRSKK